MALRRKQAFFQGVNMYVPAAGYASGVMLGSTSQFSLGSPAAVSANNIATAQNAQATVGLRVDLPLGVFTCDSVYGRTLRLTPSGNPGNSAAIDVFGEDYLGQPMVERFTGASGSTAILYGRKAFCKVIYTKVVTAASNAVTWAIGTGFRLGLPYKGDLRWAKENGIFVPIATRDTRFTVDRDAAEAIAGGNHYVKAPFSGFVKTLGGISAGAGGATDPVITVNVGGAAIVGLTVTIDTSVAANEVTDVPTTLGYNANNRFRTGDMIQIIGAAAAGAGPDEVYLDLTPTQFSVPDLTDPQTTTTGDPRGTYEPNLTPDGSEIIVSIVGDPSVNASGNGGLYGIKHVIA
jgi:hypothetical protein